MTIVERNERIVAMALDNVPPREIATLFDIGPGVVSNILSLARKAGVEVPRFGRGWRAPRSRHIVVSLGTLQELAPDARKRNTTTVSLARLIVETVAAEGLVDAVLDDAHG